MNVEVPFEDEPAWLMLPLARRTIALERRAVMLDYERHEDPGEAEAQKAARALGVTVAQFYRIRRQWLLNRNVWDLLPYGKPGSIRKPKLDPEVSRTVRNLIVKAIVTDGTRAPAEILRTIQDQWPLKQPIPSHMTVRRYISDALKGLTKEPGGIILFNPSNPGETTETASNYGEVVVIDYLLLKVFVASEGGPVAPIIAIAFDLYTSSICGYHISFGEPGPFQLEAALQDAERRSADRTLLGSEPITPRLSFCAGTGSAWHRLIYRLDKSRYDANIRQSHAVTFGEIIGDMMGSAIGVVGIATRRILNDLIFDPSRDALISFDKLQYLIDDGIREWNRNRTSEDTKFRTLKFNF